MHEIIDWIILQRNSEYGKWKAKKALSFEDEIRYQERTDVPIDLVCAFFVY